MYESYILVIRTKKIQNWIDTGGESLVAMEHKVRPSTKL